MHLVKENRRDLRDEEQCDAIHEQVCVAVRLEEVGQTDYHQEKCDDRAADCECTDQAPVNRLKTLYPEPHILRIRWVTLHEDSMVAKLLGIGETHDEGDNHNDL